MLSILFWPLHPHSSVLGALVWPQSQVSSTGLRQAQEGQAEKEVRCQQAQKETGGAIVQGHKLWVCFMTVSAFRISSPYDHSKSSPSLLLLISSSFPIAPLCGQRIAVQMVDNSVRMSFHRDQEPDSVSSQKRLRFIKASFYGMCIARVV